MEFERHCTHIRVSRGDPFDPLPDQAVMGYRLRTAEWAYVCWVEFDWGSGGDPHGQASAVVTMDPRRQGERFEWTNLADDPAHGSILLSMHAQLVEAVATGTVKPLLGSTLL